LIRDATHNNGRRQKENSSAITVWYETRRSSYIYPPAIAEGLPIPLFFIQLNDGQSARATYNFRTNLFDLITVVITMSTRPSLSL
jgi:hypothetical protein